MNDELSKHYHFYSLLFKFSVFELNLLWDTTNLKLQKLYYKRKVLFKLAWQIIETMQSSKWMEESEEFNIATTDKLDFYKHLLIAMQMWLSLARTCWEGKVGGLDAIIKFMPFQYYSSDWSLVTEAKFKTYLFLY